MKNLLEMLREEVERLTERILELEKQLASVEEISASVKDLLTIPGIGPINATALVAAIGDIQQFRNSRELSAWLGLVPRQCSTGGKQKLLGISKRGNPYLRKLLIHGARSVFYRGRDKETPPFLVAWCLRVAERRGVNRAIVALANKLARIVWAVLAKGRPFVEGFLPREI